MAVHYDKIRCYHRLDKTKRWTVTPEELPELGELLVLA